MTDPNNCPNCGGELSVHFDEQIDDWIEYCGNCPFEALVEHKDEEAA
jgi:ribosomal protein S27AE